MDKDSEDITERNEMAAIEFGISYESILNYSINTYQSYRKEGFFIFDTEEFPINDITQEEYINNLLENKKGEKIADKKYKED